MSYTPIFHRPYPDGYKNRPNETTPETAETLNAKDDVIIHIEEYLAEGDMGTTVIPNPELSGDESALNSIQIGEDKFKVEGGGGNANIWYGTHAEYEAQEDTIADGTQVCFTDDIGLEAGSEYYSETEQVIGTCLGKPLYRKIITGNINANETVTILPLTNIDEIVNVSGYIKTSTNNKVYIGYSSANAYASLFYNNPSSEWRLYHAGLSANATYQLILEYTKTTDSVVGVINGIRCGEVYSDVEQVIGSWFGKPLYSKTVYIDSLPNNAVKLVDTGIPNSIIDIAFISEGFYYNPDADNFTNLVNLSVPNTATPPVVSGQWYTGLKRSSDNVNMQINIVTGTDRTPYKGYVTIKYTKVGD